MKGISDFMEYKGFFIEKNGKLKVSNFICSTYVNIIRGTPVLLQLMIIYYVIFKSIEINGRIEGINFAYGKD